MAKAKNIKSDKRQTELLIGVAMLVLCVIFVYFGISQPRISVSEGNAYNSSYSQNNANKSSEVRTVSFANQDNLSSGVTYPLNLNTCTAADLMTIKGVGESKAQAIIAYRDVLGGYTNTEQLMNISGIGESVYAKIAPYVTV